MRHRLATVLKLAVTIAGIVVVLWQVEPRAVANALLTAQPGWLLLSFLLVNVGLFVRAGRWMLLLRALKSGLAFRRLLALYYAGNFFNTFLPTSFGGDLIRVVEVARRIPGGTAAGAVLVDRLSGLLMLFVLALVALPLRPPHFPDPLAILVAALSLGGLVVGVLVLDGGVVRAVTRAPVRWLPRYSRQPFWGRSALLRLLRPLSSNARLKLRRFFEGLKAALQTLPPRTIVGALGVSLLFNLILTLWWWAAARALGLAIPYTYLLLVIPILSISMLVPSIGGLGVREAVAGPLFAALGAAAANAAISADAIGPTLSLLVFLLERLVGLAGGPVYLTLLRRESVSH